MTNYKDLTGDDVLQVWDEYLDPHFGTWNLIPKWYFGLQAKERCYSFRRPLTTREIVAAERVKFERYLHYLTMLYPQYLEKHVNRVRTYKDARAELDWRIWCAALGIDPMGDVE